MNDEQIRAGMYRSLPARGRRPLAERLAEQFGPETCAGVPGFYVKEENGGRWRSLAGASGLLIPVRDGEGRIIALKVRADEASGDAPRYSYISSKKHGGPGPGCHVHLPLFERTPVVRLTEGELKADVATVLSGAYTISIPGVSLWKPAISVLKELAPERVLVAFDADAYENPLVARHLKGAIAALRAEGLEVVLETWDGSSGKGIDDLLAGGGKPAIVSGLPLDTLLSGLDKLASPRASERPATDAARNCADSAGDFGEWNPPFPLDEHNPPPFPVHVLPDWLQQYVAAVSEDTQTPPDLAGMLSLAALATAASGRYCIAVRDGWWEPLNLFVLVGLPPASRKSAVLAKIAAPIWDYESCVAARESEEIAKAQAERKTQDARLAHLTQLASKANADEKPALVKERDELAAALRTSEPRAEFRMLVDDVTAEKLASHMSEQDGRIALLSAEGGLFENIAGRYSKGVPNLDVFLKGHAGDTLRVDRQGRRTEFIKRPALTLGLAVQPDVIRSLGDKPGFRGRGLLARFLYSIPRSNMGRRQPESAPVPRGVEAEYQRRLRALLELSSDASGQRGGSAYLLLMESDAQRRLVEFAGWLEPQLAETETLGSISDWAGKLVGAVARIAGNLHLADYVGSLRPEDCVGTPRLEDYVVEDGSGWPEAEPRRTPLCALVRRGVVERAILLAHYLIEHARAAFHEMQYDPKIGHAKRLLGWIKRHGRERFSKRDAFNGVKGPSIQTVDDLEPVLRLLAEHDYIRVLPQEDARGPGRPRGQEYEVNPYVLSPQNPQNSAPGLLIPAPAPPKEAFAGFAEALSEAGDEEEVPV